MRKQSTLYADVLKGQIFQRQTKSKAMALTAVAMLLTSTFSSVFAAGGDLDTSFDLDGIAVADVGAYNATRATAVQADGKVLAGGSSSSDPLFDASDFGLARFNTDGRLDQSFGNGGKVLTDFGDKESLSAIAIQPDGRIVLAGKTAPAQNPTDTDIAIARYRIDGSLDPTFGSGGQLIFSLSAPIEAVAANDVALQADGKIVVAGSIMQNITGQSIDFFVARFTSSGNLDMTFGGGVGYVTTEFPSSVDEVWSMRIQGDGKIVVAGTSYNASTKAFGMVRYDPNGSLDTSFGSGGKVLAQLFTTMNGLAELLLLGNGKFILAGTTSAGTSSPGEGNFTLIRYNANGSLDTSFGSAGTAYIEIGNASRDWATDAALQSDGKIVVVGYSDPAQTHSCLARFNSNGSVDTSFGIAGSVITEVDDVDYCTGVAIQGDGRIVTSSVTQYIVETPTGTYSYGHNFAVARYLDGGSPQPADLSIQMTDSPDPVNLNGILTYNITVTNTEFLYPKAAHVTVQDTLPAGTTFVSLQAPSGWVVYEKPAVGASGKISCSSYTLGAGQSAQFTLAVRVRSGSTISNMSQVKSLTPDPISGNNKVTSVTSVN